MSSDLSTVLFTATFLLPVIISNDIVERMVPSITGDDNRYIFHCLIYSALNLVITGHACEKILTMLDGIWLAYALSLCLASVVSVFLGLIIGSLLQRKSLERMVGKIPFLKNIINIKRSEPSAWDFAMQRAEGKLMKVELKDHAIVYGRFTDQSMTGESSYTKDLYLDKTYDVDDEGNWKEKPDSQGVYIAAGYIVKIDFLNSEDVNK